MNSFSISQLAQFSGIKQHTIRIWEQRYNALTPGRSEGNTRYYDGEQLRRLLNIVNLNNAGMKISELGVLSDEELFAMAAKLENEDNSNAHAYFISQMINAGLDYDEVAFEKAFSHSLDKCNIKEVYLNILYPLMVRLGFMWSNDIIPPAQEHFLSNLMKQKLFSLINAVAPSKIKSDAWLLFLPEDEFHEIGLLYANYVLRVAGKKVYYLGGNIPLPSINDVIEKTNPKNILLFLVRYHDVDNTRKYLINLSKENKSRNIFVAGHPVFTQHLGKFKDVQFLHSVDELEEQLLPSS